MITKIDSTPFAQSRKYGDSFMECSYSTDSELTQDEFENELKQEYNNWGFPYYLVKAVKSSSDKCVWYVTIGQYYLD